MTRFTWCWSFEGWNRALGPKGSTKLTNRILMSPGRAAPPSAACREYLLKRQEVEEGELAIHIEVGHQVAPCEGVLEREGVEEGHLPVSIEVGRAPVGGADRPHHPRAAKRGFVHPQDERGSAQVE